MPPMDDTGNWDQNRKLVMTELERCASNIHGLRGDVQAMDLRIEEKMTGIEDGMTDLKVDIAGLKAKSMAWGAVAGCIVAPICVLIIELLAKKVFGL